MNPWLAAGAAAVLLFLLHRGGALPSAPTSDSTIPLTSSNAGPGGTAVALPPGEGGSSQGSADVGGGTDTQSSIVSTYTADYSTSTPLSSPDGGIGGGNVAGSPASVGLGAVPSYNQAVIQSIISGNSLAATPPSGLSAATPQIGNVKYA